jgi:hypothetical protein
MKEDGAVSTRRRRRRVQENTYLYSLPVLACRIPITVYAGSPMNEQFRLFRAQEEM